MNEFCDFLKRSARRHGGDNRRHDEDRRRGGFGLQQTINNDCHHEKPDDCQHVSSPSYSKVQDYCSHPFYNILIFWNNTLLLLLSITKTDGSHLFQAIRKKKETGRPAYKHTPNVRFNPLCAFCFQDGSARVTPLKCRLPRYGVRTVSLHCNPHSKDQCGRL